MIQFSLKCRNDHHFDSWFQSFAAFDKLKRAGLVTCETCGNSDIEKAIMAPRVRPSRNATVQTPLSNPSEIETAINKLKTHIEQNSDYVGANFATEARAMHDGTSPERSIYGEAKPEEARKLIEEGIPVTPLPFIPGRKTN